MENLPIFTVRDPELSRWQSFIEQLLKERNPTLSISEIRNLPESQGCWTHVKLAMDKKKPSAPPKGAVDVNSVAYNSYASSYFFDLVKEFINSKGNSARLKTTDSVEKSSSSVDDWPYSTNDTWKWLSTSAGRYYITGYWELLTNGDFYSRVTYRDYKEDGNNHLDYSVINWELPANSKIALIGDWGTENDDAHEFLRALLAKGVDCIIHLGDVYYTGTKSECQDKFLKVIRDDIRSQVPVFTIPGNHEYYSFGEGFYYLIDTINKDIPITNAQQAASYFCLKTEDNAYQFLGLDTGYNDHSPYDTATSPPAPKLKSSNDYNWAKDKITNFSGKTIMLSHHQLFSHTGDMNSDQYGDSYANPHLYKHFSPYFHNKIAAWFWGHEHSFALFKNGSFGLNQGRLVGSSSYEQAKSDKPYDDNYPMVPYSSANQFLSTNAAYNNDDDADYYYPHVGAIITMRSNNNPKIEYYKYPSWKNNHAPSNPQLTLVTSEIIQNPTKSPTGGWSGNHSIKNSHSVSNKAPAMAMIGDDLYMAYWNADDGHNLWWDKPTYNTGSGKITTNPSKLPVDITTSGSYNTPTTDKHPAMAAFNGKIYLVYKDSDNTNIKWCVYDPSTNQWTKNGSIQNSEVNKTAITSNNGPSLTVFNGQLYCFYLSSSNNQTIKYVTFDGNAWTSHGGFSINGTQAASYHSVCPAVVGTADNLFIIYAKNSNSYSLNLARKNSNGSWYDMGTVSNGSSSNENIPQTSYSIAACSNGQFIRLLYRRHSDNKSISWATLDLGYYNDSDIFTYYDLDHETPTWSGGLPIVCIDTGSIPQTSAFPGYCMNDSHSFMVYPGNSSNKLWCAIQKNW